MIGAAGIAQVIAERLVGVLVLRVVECPDKSVKDLTQAQGQVLAVLVEDGLHLAQQGESGGLGPPVLI